MNAEESRGETLAQVGQILHFYHDLLSAVVKGENPPEALMELIKQAPEAKRGQITATLESQVNLLSLLLEHLGQLARIPPASGSIQPHVLTLKEVAAMQERAQQNLRDGLKQDLIERQN